MKYDIVIIGAGASGLAAAIEAKRAVSVQGRDISVLVLEKEGIPARKISAAGNGKCNFANKNFDLSNYYGNKKYINTVFSQISNSDNILFFQNIGVPFTDDGSGRLYPMSRKASSVADALVLECKRLGVDIVCGRDVKKIERIGSLFKINEEITAEKLIISLGTKAGLSAKSAYNGEEILSELGVALNKFYPCLCGLNLDKKYPKSLKGVRHICNVCLEYNGKTVFEEKGEVQFNDKGVSGIPVLQATCTASKLLSEGKKLKLNLDILPDITIEKFCQTVITRANDYRNMPCDNLFTGFIQKQLYANALKSCGIKLGEPLPRDKKSLNELAYNMKYLSFSVISAAQFENAQVCGGGVNTKELSDNLEYRKISGLYICGELVDVVGKCGGYNLSWCWSSGRLAGRSAAENLKNA